MQVYFKLLVLALYLTIYLQVKYSTKPMLDAEMVVYSTLVFIYKQTASIKDNII